MSRKGDRAFYKTDGIRHNVFLFESLTYSVFERGLSSMYIYLCNQAWLQEVFFVQNKITNKVKLSFCRKSIKSDLFTKFSFWIKTTAVVSLWLVDWVSHLWSERKAFYNNQPDWIKKKLIDNLMMINLSDQSNCIRRE